MPAAGPVCAGHGRPRSRGALGMQPVVPRCDPSDTGKGQTHAPSLLRLIHEIERLELVRARRMHPACCRLATGFIPGSSLGREPSAGAEAHDPNWNMCFQGPLAVLII